MARRPYEIPINEDTTDEDLEFIIASGKHTSDVNVLKAVARATVEKDRRKREYMAAMFNAQERARIKSQRFQEEQITRLIGAGNIDDDQKQSLSEALTAASTMELATSSSAQAGYEGIAGASDSTAGVVRDFIKSPPTTDDEFEKKIADLQKEVTDLQLQIRTEGVPLTGSSECKADFDRDIKKATTSHERWSTWIAFVNCLGGQLIKHASINVSLFGGGGNGGED